MSLGQDLDSSSSLGPKDRDAEGLTCFEQQAEYRSLVEILDLAWPDGREEPDTDELPGTLGDFAIGRVIGRGGMGVVYEAIQKSLNRRVAMKILPAGSADEPRRLERFRLEAMAAACLRHPHIVPVYLTGSERGVHFFAMQLIEGQTVAALIHRRIPHRRAAELARQAADALQYAHERGVIHRDIKPSNLLVDDSGCLWVGDFGLARVAGQSDLTQSGAIFGTIRYMSPEQASGSRSVIDHRTDVYSLGATLYELITGRPVFRSEGDNRLDLIRRIAEGQPRRPRLLDASIPRDLETIVLKALAKDPAGRYATAGEMAEDLDRFLRDRPILARAPGPLDHAAMWLRRNRRPVAATAALVLAALVGSADLLRRHNVELAAALVRAEDQERTTRRLLYASRMRLAQQTATAGQVELAQEMLAGLGSDGKGGDLRGFEWRYLNRVLHREITVLADHRSTALMIGPGGDILYSGGGDGTVLLYDLARGTEIARDRDLGSVVNDLTLSPDGTLLASRQDGEVGRGGVKLWDARSGTRLATLPDEDQVITSAWFLGDGRTVAVQDLERPTPSKHREGRLRFWQLAPGGAAPAPGLEPIPCYCTSASPDGRTLVTVAGKILTLRDAATGRPLGELARSARMIHEVVLSSDGDTIATVADSIEFWDVRTGRRIGAVPGRPVAHPRFSPDGDKLAGLQTPDRLFLAVDVRTAPRLVPLEGLSGNRMTFAFSPDGRELAGGGGECPVRRWDAATGRQLAEYPRGLQVVHAIAYSADRTSLYFSGDDGRIRARRIGPAPAAFDRIAAHSSEIWSLAFSPDGSTLFSAADDHTIKLWSPRDGSPIATLAGHTSMVVSLAVSPDGRTLASASFDRKVRLWDLPGGKVRHVLTGPTDRLRSVAFSRDGRLVAAAGNGDTVWLWDAIDGHSIAAISTPATMIRAVAFAPDEPLLIVADNDGILRGLEIPSGRERSSIPLPRRFGSLAFSPDGKTLVAGDDWGGLTIWDTGINKPTRVARDSDATVTSLAFSPDGRTLAAACSDAKVRLWDPSTGQVTLVLEGHTKRINAVAFSPDGHTLASSDHAGSIILWRDRAGGPGGPSESE
ncbi:WD40 repeat domain-containing serine/threonine protein kinase [Aquisphaera insulae]|uniref:WD40 repeat domain-containing serine/threonine protein kinase n=1 Tax=Aquisphaera insulae TaxID=2712864 RepID=UPI0013EC472F|nr:protein kinase [Aquisphaera insulae]